MERREFYSKKWKLAAWLCASLAFVAGGFFATRDSGGPEQAGGWFCVVFFGLCGLFLIKELLISSPRLVLSGEGLFDRSLGTPVIPWQSVLEVGTSAVKKSGYITLQLADGPQRVVNLSIPKRALASWNKMLGGDIFNMSLTTLDAPPNEVLNAIIKYRDHYAPKRSVSNRPH